MKKIYSIVLGMLFMSFMTTSASTPNASTSNSEKKHYSTSSDQRGRNTNVHHLNERKGPSQPVTATHLPGVTSTRAACSFSDNFDGANDMASLMTRGYLPYYRGGGPVGLTPAWYQGDATGFFPSFNGPANGYVASDYNSVTLTNDVNNWLVLPALNVSVGDLFTFFTRAPIAGATFYPDSLHIWYSASGDSTPEGLTWVLLGEFEVNATGIWEYKTFPIPTASANGRLAIQYALVNAGPDGPNSFYVGIDQISVFTPSATDAELTKVSSPESNCLLSASETVEIIVKNNGTNPIYGFDASYTLDAGVPVNETVTDTIAPGGSYTYTFTAHADLSTAGAHNFDVSVINPADSNDCNNLSSIVVYNYPLNNPLTTAYTMGFELAENLDNWKTEDVNADGVIWETIDTVAHSGSICMRKAGSAAPDDDWLFSGCLDLVGGTTYTLDYWYKIFESLTPCSLETFLATGQGAVFAGQIIIQDPIPADTAVYAHSISTFAPPSSGTYYLAFHAFSGGGTSSLRIDDINLDDGTSIGIAERSNTHDIKIYPNPGSGVFYINSHKPASKVSVEVYSISGQSVYTKSLTSLDHQGIDLSNLAKGVYSVKITSDTFVENLSVVIDR